MFDYGIILLIVFCFLEKVKFFVILGDVLYVFNLKENKYKYESINFNWKYFCYVILFFLNKSF